MKELNLNQVQEVNGGLGDLAIVALVAMVLAVFNK